MRCCKRDVLLVYCFYFAAILSARVADLEAALHESRDQHNCDVAAAEQRRLNEVKKLEERHESIVNEMNAELCATRQRMNDQVRITVDNSSIQQAVVVLNIERLTRHSADNIIKT